MKKRVVLIGSNEFTKYHFSEIRRNEYLELVGVFNLNFKHKFEIFENISQLFFKTNCDSVIISCENSQKQKYISECIKFVKNIFVELPLKDICETSLLVAKNNSRLFIANYDRENPVFNSLQKEILKDEQIFSVNYLHGYFEDCEISKENFTKDVDTVNGILKSNLKESWCKKKFKDDKCSQISFCFSTQNDILVNLFVSKFYSQNRQIMEICTDSGVYIGNFHDLSLYKILKDKKVNLRVDKDISLFKNIYKKFYDFCLQDGENLRVKNLQDLERVL